VYIYIYMILGTDPFAIWTDPYAIWTDPFAIWTNPFAICTKTVPWYPSAPKSLHRNKIDTAIYIYDPGV
jgi:hypothetical protein